LDDLQVVGVSILMAGTMPIEQAALRDTVDRRVYELIQGLPHSRVGDRYVSIVSDLGEGLGWVAAGIAIAWLGGRKGRRAGLATAAASLATTYVVQQRIKPVFRRNRPFVGREVLVVGIKTADASFPSGHAASSFAAATALSTFYPKASPLVYGLATGVGISRIHLGHHFPSDVAVGSLIGIATGTLIAWLVRLPGGYSKAR
jgi:undecaprenyl-diphosphatase